MTLGVDPEDIYHNAYWYSRGGVRLSSVPGDFWVTKIRAALEVIYGPPPSQDPIGYQLPTLADLAPYAGVSSVGGYTKYTNVPWGPCFGVGEWPEPLLGNAILQPVVTIYMPNATAPVGGYGLILRTHANGATHEITEGTGSLWQYLVDPALAGKYAFASIEFRHPVSNASTNAPDTDVGNGIQFMRALSTALNLNPSRFHGVAQSRGNLSLLTCVDVDYADAGSPIFAKTLSSKLKSIWGLNTQDSYSTTEFIMTKVVEADQAACLADPNYADNPAWRSARQLILNGSQELPFLCTTYDNPFLVPLPNHSVGRYTKAAIDANGNLRVHCPEFGQSLWMAYYARGQGHKYTTCDDVTGGAVTLQDAVMWFTLLDTEPGLTAKEARIQAIGRRLGASMHYLKDPASGAYVSQASGTPVTTEGTQFGALIDGTWGAANRLNTTTPLGATMVQSTSAARPYLARIKNGRGWGIGMDAVDDAFRVALANTSVDVYSYPEAAAPVAGATSRTTALFTVGVDKLGGKKASLIAGVANTTFNPVDLKFMHQFAQELDGSEVLPHYPLNGHLWLQ